MRRQNEDITVKGLINLFVPKIWLILLVAVVAAVLVGGYSKFLKKDTYTSDTSFMVVGGTSSIPTSGGYEGVQSVVSDYIHLLSGREFCDIVARDLQEEYPGVTSRQIASIVSMKQIPSTNAIQVYCTSTSPEFSKDVADSVRNHAYGYVKEICPYMVELRPFAAPLLATKADSKNVARNAAIAFVGAALVVMLAVFLISRFDVTIRNREALEGAYDIPILGIIPRLEVDVTKSGNNEKSVGTVANATHVQPEEKNSATSELAVKPNVVDGRVVFDSSVK